MTMTYAAFISLIPLFIISTTSQSSERIVFGSCNNANKKSMWPVIESINPQKLILLGDNIYLDDRQYHNLSPEETLKVGYKTWLANKEWISLSKSLNGWDNIMLTFDDHDFGRDNCDKHLEFKNLSQQYFWDKTQVPSSSPLRLQNGVHSSREYSYTLNENIFKYKIIMLDSRSNKDQKGSPQGDFLGQQQWAWLIRQLEDAYLYDLIIIGSSIQVLRTDALIEESWAEFADAREKLLTLLSIVNSFSNVIILSGDIHHAEFSHARCKNFLDSAETDQMSMWDFTSSGLTHSVTFTTANAMTEDALTIWNIPDNSTQISPLIITRSWLMTFIFHLYQAVSPRPHRELQFGDYYAGLNFGVIDILPDIVDIDLYYECTTGEMNCSIQESGETVVGWKARVSIADHEGEIVLHRELSLKKTGRIELKQRYDDLINNFESNYDSTQRNSSSICEPYWGPVSVFRSLLTRFVISLVLFAFVVTPVCIILWLLFALILYIFSFEQEVSWRKRIEDIYHSVITLKGCN